MPQSQGGRHVRLRDCRCRLGRLCAGRASLRRPGCERAAARGGAAGHQRKHSRAARLPAARAHGGRLGLLLRAGTPLRLPPHPATARQSARRVIVDQRDDLHPRQPARLRRLGRRRLVVGRPLPLLPEGRGQRARRVALARRRRASPGEREPLAQPHHRGLRRRGRASRAGSQRGLQRRGTGRRGDLPGDAPRRAARERRRRIPAPRDGAAESRCQAVHARAARALRGHARGRRGGATARRDPAATRRARGDPVRRRLQLAAASDALRGRSRRTPADARNRGAARAPVGGREPLRPPQLVPRIHDG